MYTQICASVPVQQLDPALHLNPPLLVFRTVLGPAHLYATLCFRMILLGTVSADNRVRPSSLATATGL